MIQQLSLTLFSLTTNQTKQFNPFLVETATCEFTIAALHHYSCFASMTLPYFMYFIKCALDFCKVRIKLLGLTFKGKQNIFPNQQPLSSPTIILPHLYYKATMMPIAIQSQQVPLICTLIQQGSLAVAQVVMSFLLSLLIYAIFV